MPGDGPTATLSYLAYRTAAALALALPEPVARPVARYTGRVLGLALRGRRRMLARHLRRVYGPTMSDADLRRATTATFESYARYWLEAFRLPKETPESLIGRIEVEGLEHVEGAMAGGRGVIMATPHLGNWDLGGAWFAARGYRPATVVEPIDPPQLFDWFCAYRRRLGMDIVALSDDPAGTMLRALREGRMVGLICDRDMLGNGVEVEFFGERTTLPAGPATLAVRAGVEILPAALYFRQGQRHLCVIRPPVPTQRQGRLREDLVRITQALARELEVLVRRAPEQWHLLQPNWPSDLGGAVPGTPQGVGVL